MQAHYNRRDRRKFAKQLGLIGKGESHGQAAERRARSREAGEQIHRQFLAENEVRLREAAAEREAKILESWTKSHGAEEAAKQVANMKRVEKERQEKLAKRRLKQKGGN